MLWLFVGPTRVYLLDFFCSGSSVTFTVESLSLLYLDFYVLGDDACIDKLLGRLCKPSIYVS